MKKGNVCLYLAKMDPTIICGNLQKKRDWLEVSGMRIICEYQCEKMKLNSGIISQFLENIFNQ